MGKKSIDSDSGSTTVSNTKPRPSRVDYNSLPESTPITSLSRKLQSTLTSLCAEHQRLASEISERVSTQKDISEVIASLCTKVNSRRIEFPDGSYTTRCQRSSTSINPNKLAELGVGVEIIEQATETNWSEEYVKIIKPKPKKDSDKGDSK